MLSSLENSAFSIWLLGSNSIWAYPTVLTVHTFGMMVLVGAALAIDLRLLGFGRDIPLRAMQRLFTVIWFAFAVNALTGSMLFVADASKRGLQLIFWMKLLLVAIGLATSVMIRRANFADDDAPLGVTRPARRLALISLFAWSAAITAGRLLAYVG